MDIEPPRIAGPVAQPKRPAIMPPSGAWDSHFHIFHDWTPDEDMRRRILVDTPARLFGR